jgi:hypothetical protein
LDRPRDWRPPPTGFVQILLKRLPKDPRLKDQESVADATQFQDRKMMRIVLGHALQRAEMLLGVSAEWQ